MDEFPVAIEDELRTQTEHA